MSELTEPSQGIPGYVSVSLSLFSSIDLLCHTKLHVTGFDNGHHFGKDIVDILRDPGAVSRVGGKGWTKVFKYGQKQGG